MKTATFDEILDVIDHLPADEQADLIEVVRRRLNEAGRRRIMDDIREGEAEFKLGQVRQVSVDELMREIGS